MDRVRQSITRLRESVKVDVSSTIRDFKMHLMKEHITQSSPILLSLNEYVKLYDKYETVVTAAYPLFLILNRNVDLNLQRSFHIYSGLGCHNKPVRHILAKHLAFVSLVFFQNVFIFILKVEVA